jgi:hypothetical protein
MHADPSQQINALFTTWTGDLWRAYERAKTDHERRARGGDRTLERTLEVLSATIGRLRDETRETLEGIDSPLTA